MELDRAGRGEYDWSAYDELTRNLEQRGLRPYYILDYSNPLYEDTVVSRNPLNGQEQRDIASPQHPTSIDAFAGWAGDAVLCYKGRHVIWEIWNEPNISFWKPRPDVEQYNQLALATCKAIRQSDPAAIVVAPATSEFPWEFLERFFASGVLTYLDGVSVHPYRAYERSPETAAADYQRLRALIAHSAPAEKKTLPILSGEWGYASHERGVSPQRQAEFLVRQQLSNLLHGVPVSIWYDWKNDGEDPTEREQNFGTVTYDLEPKPAYVALQTLTRQLGGFRIERRLEVGREDDYVLLLVNDAGQRRFACWTAGEPHSVDMELPAPVPSGPGVSVVRGTGQADALPITAGRVHLPLAPLPSYLIP